MKDKKLGLFRWTSEEAKPDIKGAKKAEERLSTTTALGESGTTRVALVKWQELILQIRLQI